jgi:hypothetical protein
LRPPQLTRERKKCPTSLRSFPANISEEPEKPVRLDRELYSRGRFAQNSAVNAQGEFDFEGSPSHNGHALWLAGRKLRAEALARRINLPLGRQVEVWLSGGVRLRGLLRLREEQLLIEEERVRHLELMVDHVPFTYREMESCVRLD